MEFLTSDQSYQYFNIYHCIKNPHPLNHDYSPPPSFPSLFRIMSSCKYYCKWGSWVSIKHLFQENDVQGGIIMFTIAMTYTIKPSIYIKALFDSHIIMHQSLQTLYKTQLADNSSGNHLNYESVYQTPVDHNKTSKKESPFMIPLVDWLDLWNQLKPNCQQKQVEVLEICHYKEDSISPFQFTQLFHWMLILTVCYIYICIMKSYLSPSLSVCKRDL